jgi:hypothetical protein
LADFTAKVAIKSYERRTGKIFILFYNRDYFLTFTLRRSIDFHGSFNQKKCATVFFLGKLCKMFAHAVLLAPFAVRKILDRKVRKGGYAKSAKANYTKCLRSGVKKYANIKVNSVRFFAHA